jgi:hypothetical protein
MYIFSSILISRCCECFHLFCRRENRTLRWWWWPWMMKFYNLQSDNENKTSNFACVTKILTSVLLIWPKNYMIISFCGGLSMTKSESNEMEKFLCNVSIGNEKQQICMISHLALNETNFQFQCDFLVNNRKWKKRWKLQFLVFVVEKHGKIENCVTFRKIQTVFSSCFHLFYVSSNNRVKRNSKQEIISSFT